MTDKDAPKPSKVVPSLVAALVCDVVAEEPSTQKKSLIGVFSHIAGRSFPVVRQFSLYVKLTDAEGFYRIEVRFVQLKENKVLVKGTTQMQVRDRLSAPDFFVPFQPLRFEKPGRYDFQVFANDVYLGSAFVDAGEMPVTPEEGE